MTPVGRQRGTQLSELAVELARTVAPDASIKYRTRLLQLAWDRRSPSDVLHRGRELLSASQALQEPENYDAMRYIAMVLFEVLHVQPYDTHEHQLPVIFPETMDGLLGKLNSQRPGDIEIARRYAEFLVSVGSEERANFTTSASEQVRLMSEPDRLARARDIIDVMVQHNTDDPAAYLARFHFTRFTERFLFLPFVEAPDLASPDLQRVLELAPSNSDGLVFSSIHAREQADIARRSGELERARQWEQQAEGYLRRTIRDNPGDPRGYLHLGDHLSLFRQNPGEAIVVWSEGLRNAGIRGGDEELIGRLIMALLGQGRVEEARARLGDLSRTINEMRDNRPADVLRTQNVQRLLAAQLYYREATLALVRIEAAMRENRPEEARRLRGVVQQMRGNAVRRFEEVLIDFGSADDFITELGSVYSLLLPQSLFQLGLLKSEMGQWDSAVRYFYYARQFPVADRRRILEEMLFAFQQLNQLDMEVQALSEATRIFPDDLSIRYAHTMTLFRSAVASNAATPATFDAAQRELEALESFREELLRPWILDVRRAQLDVARANLTNQAETILEATNEAVRRFRALERQTFPPDADGNVRNYIDEPAFVDELVRIYSSWAARADFDRLLERLRAFPDGEVAYYEARINDALRRGSLNEAAVIIQEAIESPRLSDAQRERLVAFLQNLRGENQDHVSILDRDYERLRTTFDESPESLRPQELFLLADMSLDRGEMGRAQRIRERLERIEGPAGTNWRYIAVRQMLAEENPDYNEIRAIQEVVVRYRPNWDMSYILSAFIEEQYLESNPDNTATRERLIMAYRNATQLGNRVPEIWRRLLGHLERAGHTEDVRAVRQDAVLRGVILDSGRGQLPQPYGRMYSQVQIAILTENATEADAIARQSIRLAEMRGESPGLILNLHLTLGNLFSDAGMFDSAIRHFSETARLGGIYVYLLAWNVARSGDIDGGFSLLLDEIDLVPAAIRVLLPLVSVLLAQIQPSEAIYERIDTLMNRVERGERLTLRGVIEPSDEDFVIVLGTRWVEHRIIRSLVVRFPESTENLDTSAIQFISPEELTEELAEEGEPVRQAQGVSRPAITNIPGGFFVEWAAPVELAAIQLDRGLTGPLEIMFDVPSVEYIAEMGNKPSPITDSDMVTALTDYWISRGRPERAIPLYRESLALGNLDDRRTFVFQNNLAMLYSRVLGEHDRALEVLENALATRRDNATLLNAKGLILLNAGNPAEAIPALLRAVELSSSPPPMYCMHLAYAFHLDGHSGQARQWFDTVRNSLIPLLPDMSSENRAIFDALQLAFPPIGI